MPSIKTWSDDAIDLLYNYSREPEDKSYFRDLFAKVFFIDDASITKGKKYCVVLADNWNNELLVLNKILLEQRLAEEVVGEDLNSVEVDLPFNNEEFIDDEGEDIISYFLHFNFLLLLFFSLQRVTFFFLFRYRKINT